jgi:hypothetical protein
MSENGTIQPVDQRRLVRLARGRWLYAFSLDAEAWGGCCKNLDDAIEMAFREAADEEREAGTKIYFAHGCPMPKAECDSLGLEWPWYGVDPKDAITILLPNANCPSDSGARILHKEDVILALMGVGLGAKLINQALENLGFPLDPFPSQNDTAQATPTKRP